MPFENEIINPQEIKSKSEQIILSAGGEILDWLPTLEISKPRSVQEIINRALVLNAMFQLHLNAPKYYIADWIEQNSLATELTPNEFAILCSPNELSHEEHYQLYYSLDSLWAIAWATNLIQELPFNQDVGDELAKLSPNLQINENGDKYQSTMHLRSIKSLYMMLDLYYRVHWWVNNAQKENKAVTNVVMDAVKARRKALEWILDCNSKWDEVDLSL